MSNPISLKKNFIMNAILTMSSFLFPLISFPYVSRILLPEGTGKVQLATSIITYFAMFAQLGIPTYGVKICAQVRDDKEKLSRTVHELLTINTIMSVISYVCFLFVLMFVPKLHTEKPLYIIVSLTILFNVVGMEWLYKALEQYSYITIRSLIFKFIAVIAMFLFVHQKSDYIIYGVITIFAASASSVMNFINVRKFIYTKPIGGYNYRKHFKAVLIYFAMSCATTIYLNLDTVMLGFIKDDAAVGHYNAAVKIKSILVSIVTSLGTVLLPRVSYYYENGYKDEFLRITKKALNFVILMAAPFMVYFILFSREGILFLSGDSYGPAVLPMQLIMPTLLFIGMTNIMGIQILVPMGREKYVLYSEIAGAIVDLVLNIILIPRFASAGAAFGTMIAEIVVWMVQYIVLKDMIAPIYRDIKYIGIIVALGLGTALALCTRLIPFKALAMPDVFCYGAVLTVSALVFFGTYVITLLLFKEPLALEIKQMIVRKIKRVNI